MTKVMEYNFNLFIDDSIFENIFMVWNKRPFPQYASDRD
jgi:hypothetical protein